MRKNPGRILAKACVKRVIRLAPTYYFVTFMTYFTFKFFGSGPMFPSGVERFIHRDCEAHWWHNLIFINNILPLHPTAENQSCLNWMWYVANDLQFFILLIPASVYLYVKKHRKTLFFFLCCVSLGSVISNFVSTLV